MSRLHIKEIKAVFEKIKLLAEKEFSRKNYELSLKYIETAADIAYAFNWKYADEVLEDLLIAISNEIIGQQENIIAQKGKVVFYDVFALDNRGLTQQYIRAILNLGMDLLFVFDGSNLLNSKQILSEINSSPQAELFIVDATLSKVEKIKLIYEKIRSFKPEMAFLHLYPSSTVPLVVWNKFKEVKRYQINLTDHAFWLGTKCIDYSIEFRDYGYTVSLEKRNLSNDQLLFQPFYPIVESQSFKGFPSEITLESIKVLTGGNFYKMYGKSNVFFELLKILIEVNSKVVILLVGSGDDTLIKEFISKNKYEKRLFLLGTRSDISEVFKNSDIYLSTYPFSGGLMAQYSAVFEKPILAYTSEDLECNFLEGLINWKADRDFNITCRSFDSFKIEAEKLIKNKLYRRKRGIENKRFMITESEFEENLKNLINFNKPAVFKKRNIDYLEFSNLYLELENNYLKQFSSFITSRFKVSSLLFFPKHFFLFLFSSSNIKFLIKRRIIKFKKNRK